MAEFHNSTSRLNRSLLTSIMIAPLMILCLRLLEDKISSLSTEIPSTIVNLHSRCTFHKNKLAIEDLRKYFGNRLLISMPASRKAIYRYISDIDTSRAFEFWPEVTFFVSHVNQNELKQMLLSAPKILHVYKCEITLRELFTTINDEVVAEVKAECGWCTLTFHCQFKHDGGQATLSWSDYVRGWAKRFDEETVTVDFIFTHFTMKTQIFVAQKLIDKYMTRVHNSYQYEERKTELCKNVWKKLTGKTMSCTHMLNMP